MTDLTTIITALASKYGPASVDLAMSAIKVNGIANLTQGLILGGVAVALGFVIRWCDSQLREDEDSFPLFMLMFLSGLAFLGTAIFSLTELFDVWNWVAIFSPETYAAAKLMHLGGR